MADLPPNSLGAYISPMCPGNDNQVDWSAAATPQGEQVLPSLSRPSKTRVISQTRRGVMDTLLGQNDLSAHDVSGSDPYNSTGRQFRR
jgi:hypothetical protein